MQRFDKSLFRLFIEGLAQHTATCISSKPEAQVDLHFVLTALLSGVTPLLAFILGAESKKWQARFL